MTTALVVVVAAAVVVVAAVEDGALDGTKLPVAVAVGAGISSEELGTLAVVEMMVMGWQASLWPGQTTLGLMMGWREVVSVGCGGWSLSEEEEEEESWVVMGQSVVETATVSVTRMMEDASVPDWQGVEAEQEVMVLVVVV